jgi:hypothetical protein
MCFQKDEFQVMHAIWGYEGGKASTLYREEDQSFLDLIAAEICQRWRMKRASVHA